VFLDQRPGHVSPIQQFKMVFLRLTALAAWLICQNAAAQKQNYQWRFGTGGGIDFASVPPSFVSGAAISTGEGSASVADRTTGALLFYTDGVRVWNAANQVMPNGTGLLGGQPSLLSSTTAAVIVPKPGSSTQYYVVTVDEQGSNNGVRYSVVDMTLDGGLGDVVAGQKNLFLFQTNSEKLEVVPSSDGLGYWLLTHDLVGNSFYSFKIDGSGIQSTPVVSQIGGTQSNGAGHMKINRQFNQIALGLLNSGIGASTQVELFDFDNTTGIVSNRITWNYNPVTLIYGIEFSPNGEVLYVSDLQKLVQYDIRQPTPSAIENSAYVVSTNSSTSLQLGVDDRIYINEGSLSAITCPNSLGAACGYQTNVIPNQTAGGGYGLPKWVYYASDSPVESSNSIVYGDSCAESSILFTIQNTTGITSVVWNFGDPGSGTHNTASGLTASHTFSQPGTYRIQAIITGTCGVDTVELSGFTVVDCSANCPITIPNVFSPNVDGVNDVFSPKTTCPFERYEWSIYTRWGQLVYETTRSADVWNGRVGSSTCPDGVYYCVVKYALPGQPEASLSGFVSLLR